MVRAADGIQLVGIDYGGGGPLALLLHGLGEHLLALERLATALAPDLRVVAVDLRWSGRSGSSSRFDWQLLVNDAECVMNSLGAPSAYVLGHSLGGIVATYYGAAHPDSAGIVNIDGWGFGDPALYDGMSRDEAIGIIDALRTKMDPLASFPRAGDAAWAQGARSILRQVLVRRGLADEDLDRWLDRMVVPVGDERWQIRPDPVIYDSMRSDAGVFELLGGLECPALVLTSDINSALDEVTGARRRGVGQRLSAIQQMRPNLSVKTIPDSQHESLVREHVGPVAQAIRDWLDPD
jgi:pimeloyl-ACP methyl ester carboxylesterase